jgi:hypothetical protein
MKELKQFANSFLTKHPEFKKEVEDLIQLCADEIEDGGSAPHEIELCKRSIVDLLLVINRNCNFLS